MTIRRRSIVSAVLLLSVIIPAGVTWQAPAISDTLATALIGFVSGAVPATIGVYIALRKLQPETKVLEASAEKTDAETAEIIGRTWSGIVAQLRADLEASRLEIVSLKAAQQAMAAQIAERDAQRDKDRRLIRALQKQVAALRAQLVDLGHEPYRVDDLDPKDDESQA